MLAVSFTLFIILMIIGTPIAFAMGLSGVIGFLTCSNIDTSGLVQQICGDLISFSLMAAEQRLVWTAGKERCREYER